MVANHIVNKIRTIPAPHEDMDEDRIIWGRSENGEFSIKQAYILLDNNLLTTAHLPWDILWKTECPERWKFQLWKAGHDRLLTNSRCHQWGLGDGYCDQCTALEETTLHAIRDCTQARTLWTDLINPSEVNEFFSYNLFSWCRDNLQNGKGVFQPKDWKIIFLCVIYYVWHWRNKRKFETNFQYPHNLKNFILLQVQGMVIQNSHKNMRQIGTIFIHWIKPPDGWIKLNTDGASKGNPGAAGCGGLFRDEEGKWISGFYNKIGTTTAYMAELWGIYSGLLLAWEKGFTNLIVECDSLSIINSLNKEDRNTSRQSNSLVAHINRLKRRRWTIQFRHTKRESNICADYLANYSLDKDYGCYTLQEPNSELKSLLFLDYFRTALPKDSSIM